MGEYTPEQVARYQSAGEYLKTTAAKESLTFTNEAGQQQAAFTSNQNQFHNERYLLSQAISDPGTRQLYSDRAAISFNEMSAASGLKFGANAATGFARGVPQGIESGLKSYAALLDSETYAKLVHAAEALADDPAGTLKQLADGMQGAGKDVAFKVYLDWLQKDSRDMGTVSGEIFGNTLVDMAAAATGLKVAGLATDTARNVGNMVGRQVSAKLEDIAEQTLLKTGGVFDSSGQPMLDLSKLTIDQKRVAGELFGEYIVKQIVPDGTKIARMQGVGETGIDDIYKVSRPDVDYVVIEYKFNQSSLGYTQDGKQGSITWILGKGRIQKAVEDQDQVKLVEHAIDTKRFETWVVRTLPDGSTKFQVLDEHGYVKRATEDASRILNLTEIQP